MAGSKYSEYLQISPNYESVVDIGADQRNANLWREYVVGDDMCTAVDRVCMSVRKETTDSAKSFWLHGSYGTGKSYAGIFLKHLFEEPASVVDAFMKNNPRLQEYRNRFMPIREHGDFLSIWKSGCSDVSNGPQLLMAIEVEIIKALKAKFGDKAELGGESLVDIIRNRLNDNSINWDAIRQDPTYNLYAKFATVDQIRAAVDAGRIDVIGKLAAIMRDKGWAMVDSVEQFRAWVKDVVKANGLSSSGIVFFWDEFTEYLRHGTAPDLDVVQKISEFTKDCPLYLFFIVHVDTNFLAAVGQDSYSKYVSDRFHEIEFKVSENSAHDLIANSIVPRPGMDATWKEKKAKVLKHLQPFYSDLVSIDDDNAKASTLMDRLCPIHPMTIKLLSRVAGNFAAASRTMFKFMKDSANTEIGFIGYINNNGPEDQTCWLTPDVLWDYFFLSDADYHDKESKVPTYIQHYYKKYDLLTADVNALRVFKCAMLLMSVMSTAGKAMYLNTRRSGDVVDYTTNCLKLCFTGVYSEEQIDSWLDIFSAEGTDILKLQPMRNGNARLELPFAGGGDEFNFRRSQNAKTHSRYQLFNKDGAFAKSVEASAWDKNDAVFHRVRIAACCAETNSLKARSAEVAADIRKAPYKFGIVIVAIQDAAQYQLMQSTLHQKAMDLENQDIADRMIYVLLKTPLEDTTINKWLDEITYEELSKESGSTGSAQEHGAKAAKEIEVWKNKAITSTVVIYCGDNVITGVHNLSEAASRIKKEIIFDKFKFAPETFIITETAYKPCAATSPTAGIVKKGNNSQTNNVIDALRRVGVLECDSIETLASADGSTGTRAVAKLAAVVHDELTSGTRVHLTDLWKTLQTDLGYYDSIACGVLLGFVFSFYVNGEFTWTDETQNPFVLNEAAMASMINTMVKGKIYGGFLSSGTQAWFQFKPYAQKLFALSPEQAANEGQTRISARDKITSTGVPYWAMKYLTDEEYGSVDNHNGACQIIDKLQAFVDQSIDADIAMGDSYNLFRQYPRVRGTLEKTFASKPKMAEAFRNYIFSVRPEIQKVSDSIGLQPIELNDQIHGAMQGAVYSWSEEKVSSQLDSILVNLTLLDTLNHIVGVNKKELAAVQKDIKNLLDHICVPVAALEVLNAEWFEAAKILLSFAKNGIRDKDQETIKAESAALAVFGGLAWTALTSGKLLVKDLLEARHVEFTEDDLNGIYSALCDADLDAESSVTQFDHALNDQLKKITYSKNREILKSTWTTISGTDSVKTWSNRYGVPLVWVVPDNMQSAVTTLISIQQGGSAMDSSVVSAINAFKSMDVSILTDKKQLDDIFFAKVGEEYRSIRDKAMTQIKLKCGSEVNNWAMKANEITAVLKSFYQAEMRKQKLDDTKQKYKTFDPKDTGKVENVKKRVLEFLEKHPEYCDDFADI